MDQKLRSKFISISKFVLVVGGLASWWWFAAQPFVLANDFRRNLKRGVMALPTQSFKEYCTDYWSKLKMQIAANTYFWVDKYNFPKAKKSTWDRNPPAVSCNVSFREEQAVFGREEGAAVLASEGPCQQGALLLLRLLEEGHQVQLEIEKLFRWKFISCAGLHCGLPACDRAGSHQRLPASRAPGASHQHHQHQHRHHQQRHHRRHHQHDHSSFTPVPSIMLHKHQERPEFVNYDHLR